jgi:PBP1b-binding outer membrane lipoprotein LpoB
MKKIYLILLASGLFLTACSATGSKSSPTVTPTPIQKKNKLQTQRFYKQGLCQSL